MTHPPRFAWVVRYMDTNAPLVVIGFIDEDEQEKAKK
jgi:hypothetical protein